MNQPKQATMREKKSIALLRAALCISAIALPAGAEPPRLSTMQTANSPVALPSSAALATAMERTTESVDTRITKLIGLKRKLVTCDSRSGKVSQANQPCGANSNQTDWLDAALQSRKKVNDVSIVATTPNNAGNSRVEIAANSFEPAQLALVSASSQGSGLNAPAKITEPQAGAVIASLEASQETVAHAEQKLDATAPDSQSLLDIDMDDLGPPLSSVDVQTDDPSLMTNIDGTASNESTGNEPARLKVASIGASSGAPRPLLQVQVGNLAVTAETCRLTDRDTQSSFVPMANPMVANGHDSPHNGTFKLSDASGESAESIADNSNAEIANSPSIETKSTEGPTASSIAVLSSGLEGGHLQSIETQTIGSNEPLVELVEQAPAVETPSADVQGDTDSLLTIPAQTLTPVETATPEFEVLVEKKPTSSPIVREAQPTHAINRVLRDGIESHSAFAGLIGQITESTPREDVEIPRRASKSLELPGTIIDFAVENLTFCQAMKVNVSSITLIGLRVGQTRLAVRYEDAAGNTALRVYLLSIFNSNNSNISDVELAQELAKTVKSLYPASKLEVVTERGSLVVRGTAASEDEAQSVLTLVRRTTLRPVVDRLTTRR